MNTPQIQAAISQVLLAPWSSTFGNWLVGTAPLVVTYREFLGSIEEELGNAGTPAGQDLFALPEIDPDEFERVFNWFQS